MQCTLEVHMHVETFAPTENDSLHTVTDLCLEEIQKCLSKNIVYE